MSIFSLFLSASLLSTSCQATPYGSFQDSNLHICHKGYYTDYNTTEHIPIFVSWNITKDMTISCNKRDGSFTQDPQANNLDVSSSTYNSSGYDRGHMANAADFLFNLQEEHESFYMTNILPQNPTNNRGGWKWFELQNRSLANEYGDVQIYAGGDDTDKSLYLGDILVPKYLWKVAYIPSQNKAIALYVPNSPISGSDIMKYRISVSQLEKKLNRVIPLPNNYDKNNIDNISLDINLTKEKMKRCRI